MKTYAFVTSFCLSFLCLWCPTGARRGDSGRPAFMTDTSLRLSVGASRGGWPPHAHPPLRGPLAGRVRPALVDGIEGRAEGVDYLTQTRVLGAASDQTRRDHGDAVQDR